MKELLPLLFIIFVAVSVAKSSAKKTSAKKPTARPVQQITPKPKADPWGVKPQRIQPMQPAQSMQPQRLQTMMPPPPAPIAQPVHDHDHPGSLGDLHDEGYDPCHEDQLQAAKDPAMATQAQPAVPAPGLSLSWTKDELVKGFVMGEILQKPRR